MHIRMEVNKEAEVYMRIGQRVLKDANVMYRITKYPTPVYYNNKERKESFLVFVMKLTWNKGVWIRTFKDNPVMLYLAYNDKQWKRMVNVNGIVCVDNKDLSNVCITALICDKMVSSFYFDVYSQGTLLLKGNGIVCNICFKRDVSVDKVATLPLCGHQFCFECILSWSKLNKDCPICETKFSSLQRGDSNICIFNSDKEIIAEKDKIILEASDFCMVCHRSNNSDVLLVCDNCNYHVCHTYCAGLQKIPDGNWYCKKCLNGETIRRRKKH